MAGDWIKIRTCLFTHPKVMRIAKHCGWGEEVVVGWLAKVWSWADSATESGHVDSVTHDDLARVTGAPLKFLAAVQSVGWLVQDASGIAFPDYEEHMAQSAKARVLAANRKRKSRSSMSRAQRDSVSRAQRDKSVTREEKTREETFSRRRLQNLEFVGSVAAPAAKRILLTRRAGIPRELAWQAACLLTAIDEDEVDTLCAKLTSGTVESPGRYIGGVCKHFCRERGLDWAEVKQAMPACPQPKEEVVGG